MLDHLAGADIVLNLSAYRDYESGGRVPGAQRLEEMAAALGSHPEEPVEAKDLVAAAIRDQTEVLRAVLEELRGWRDVDRERLTEHEATMKRLVELTPCAPGTAAPPVPRPQPVRVG
jgi:transcriptional regulator with XRE-family HTH domain